VTREEAAKLPLWVRRIAAKAWCDAWNDRGRGMEDFRGPHYDLTYAHVVYKFALDLPDTPATRAREIAEAVKPWRDEVKGLADLIDEHAPMGVGYEVRKAYIEHARALLAAAQGASHE